MIDYAFLEGLGQEPERKEEDENMKIELDPKQKQNGHPTDFDWNELLSIMIQAAVREGIVYVIRTTLQEVSKRSCN